jgi:hypothetical protein
VPTPEQREYWQRWYAANHERELARYRRRDRERLDWLREQKGTRCSRCGREFPPEQLQWHHRDPATKLFSLGRPAAAFGSRMKLSAEIAKCDVLCRPCHDETHRELRSVVLGED